MNPENSRSEKREPSDISQMIGYTSTPPHGAVFSLSKNLNLHL